MEFVLVHIYGFSFFLWRDRLVFRQRLKSSLQNQKVLVSWSPQTSIFDFNSARWLESVWVFLLCWNVWITSGSRKQGCCLGPPFLFCFLRQDSLVMLAVQCHTHTQKVVSCNLSYFLFVLDKSENPSYFTLS